MKYVEVNRLMYDATVGRVEPGETYFVEDDKAERWVEAGVATLAPARALRQEAPPAPPPPQPDPEPMPPPEPEPEEPEDEGDELPNDDDDKILALHEAGRSQNGIAHELGIGRDRVRRVLARAGKAL